MLNSDLRYIFELFRIHMEVNNPSEDQDNTGSEEEERECYIDELIL